MYQNEKVLISFVQNYLNECGAPWCSVKWSTVHSAVVKRQIQDHELASWRVRPQRALSVVSLSKTLYSHGSVLVSNQEDVRVILRK